MAFQPYQVERTFNKDIAFLEELQRIEWITNNFAIEANHPGRLRSLTCWKAALAQILSSEDLQHINKLKQKCEPIKHQGRENWNVKALDDLHETLNRMNTKYKLQLRSRDTGAEAAKI